MDMNKKKTTQETQSQEAQPQKIWLSVEQAAEILHYSRSYLYKLIMRKAVPYYKAGPRKVLFDQGELQEWLKGRMRHVKSKEQMAEAAASYCLNHGC